MSRHFYGMRSCAIWHTGSVAIALTLGASTASAAELSGVYAGVASASSEFSQAYVEGSRAVAGSVGKTVQVTASEFDGQKLLEQFSALFAAGCTGCAVTADPASNAFTRAIALRAARAGAKYVNIWNRPEAIHPWDTASDSWVANISFDGVASGYANGMELCKALHGKGNIVALEGVPDNPPAKQRLAGLHKALARCPGLHLLDTQIGNWDQTQGQNITRGWIVRYGTMLSGVFSSNDGMALGVVAALREKGLAGKIPVTGSDGSRDALELVKSGSMLSTMYVDGYTLGATATALAVGAVRGDIDLAKLSHAQRDFDLGETLVTAANVNVVLNQKHSASDYSYADMHDNFWRYSAGAIPVGANK